MSSGYKLRAGSPRILISKSYVLLVVWHSCPSRMKRSTLIILIGICGVQIVGLTK